MGISASIVSAYAGALEMKRMVEEGYEYDEDEDKDEDETYPSECPSCHSHEFRMHHGRWLCAFCRSSA